MERQSFLSKGINMGQAIVISITLLGTIITFYTQTKVKLNELEIRIGLQEKQSSELYNKIDKLIEGQNEIKVLLQNKVDRSNEIQSNH